jgi:transposase
VERNEELEGRLARLLSPAKKNEGVSSAQLQLFISELNNDANDETGITPEQAAANERLRDASGIDDKPKSQRPCHRRQPGLRQPAPSNLRRIPNPISVPPEQRPCPICGAERKCIGHDVTEVIELIPAEVVVRLDQREKLACENCEGELVRAPAGAKVVAAGRLGPTLVATLVKEKYWDGLPLHREKARFQSLGFKVSVSTLADQVTWATDALTPLWRLALLEVIAARVMHLDGTSLPVLDSDAPGGKRLGALWGYVGDERFAAYLYASTGKAKGQKPGELGPEDVLANREGFTVADASSVFDASFRREGLIECGCNMHGRRRFTKALDAGDTRAALPLAAYKKLYEIEAKVRDLSPDKRLEVRRQESQPVWDELCAWCNTYKPHEPPSSKLGEAIRYFTNHRIALGRFLEYGEVPIDNGIVERLHVRAALTRKNFLFAGSDEGGKRAAIAYTILSCCRLADVDPVEYLADVLPRLASARGALRRFRALLPDRWKAARTAAALADQG